MILIDNLKFACLECIRGHRSTLCRHHMRPLLQVRSKGRPNLIFPYGNRNYRVAVFAEEIDENADDVTENCKNMPVVILKASDKHVIDYTNGQIMGRYDENEEKPCLPLVQPESFVNTSTCCSSTSSRVQKNCKCNQKKVLRQKILRLFLTKKMARQELQLDHKQRISLDVAFTKTSGGCCGPKKPLDKTEPCGSNSDVAPTHTVAPKQKGSCCGSSKVKRESPLSDSAAKKDEATQVLPQRMSLDNSSYSSPYLAQDSNNFPSIRPFNDHRMVPHTQHYPSTQHMHGQNTGMITNVPAGMTGSDNTNIPSMSNSMANSMTNSTANTMHNPVSSMNSMEQGYFQVISVPSCSIPGTCLCTADCSCPSCVVHNNAPSQSEDSLAFLNSDQQYDSNLILKLETQMPNPMATRNALNPASGDAATLRYARELPREMEPQFNYRAQFPGFEMNSNPNSNTAIPPFISELQMELQTALQGLQQHPIQELQQDTSPCTCPDDECFCMNCEAHGIIEGHRLEDLFRPRQDYAPGFAPW